MRTDSFGLFWEDLPPVKARAAKGPKTRGPMPPIPETDWRTPSEFPNLAAARVIGFDTETFDPELLSAGPGWARGKGHIIGASLAVADGTSWYFPIRHETMPGDNMEPEAVLRYLAHTLGDRRPKVGANLIYDVGWLRQEGVEVAGPLYDIQFAEALLNSEAPDVTLEGLAQTYLGIGKTTSILYEWLASWLGGRASDRQRANLYLAPPSLAGPYAESDAALPIAVLEKQWPILAQRGLLDLFDLECRLIPLLVKMRFKGAPVNLSKAEAFYEELGKEAEGVSTRLRDLAGQPINPNSSDSVKSAFRALGIKMPTRIDKKTGDEKETTAAGALETIQHPIAQTILEYRRIEKVKNTFIKGYILDKNVNGILHCSFHPLRGESGGARSGRFSSSIPNLQNIPVRTEIGRRVRQCFEDTHGGRWRKYDYSQIEYRMLAHHAVGEGADELRLAYNENPKIDYHELTAELVKRLTGIDLPRRNIKNINFGLIYGMSEPKLAADLHLSLAEGRSLFKNYHQAAPFARATMDDAANEVHRRGFVSTILGRRSDFTKWSKTGYSEDRTALDYEAACRKWGGLNIERAHIHKALNRKLQGGAADVMKKAMVTAYEAGFFEDAACGMPGLTVHDELDFVDHGDLNAKVWQEFQHCMENSMPSLRVPIKMDGSYGPNWGDSD